MTDDMYELMVWLGPAASELTPEQIDRVAEAARDIHQRYPDPDDSHLRDAALSAVVQHLLGETTPEEACRALSAARQREAEAFAAAVQVAVELVRDAGGRDKSAAARRCGIDRMSLLKALGER